MSVGQMLAHCSVAYQFVNKDKNPKPLTKRHIIINLRKEGYIDNKDNLKTYIYRGGIRIILVNSYKIESSNIAVATISFSKKDI
jgi:hypothetical protein